MESPRSRRSRPQTCRAPRPERPNGLRPGRRLRPKHGSCHILLQSMLLAIALMWHNRAPAQSVFPTRPVQIVVTVPPGGAADPIARVLAAKLEASLRQPVVVVNRPGAAGTTAAGAVARAPADGYTLLLNTISTHGIGPHLYAGLPYDPVKDFAPIILVARLPLIMTVTAAVPAQSVADVVALAKARSGQLAFASSGTGGAPHLAAELFKSLAGVDMLHVPYRGSGPAVIDLVAGRVAIMFDAAPSLLPFIVSGAVRPLAAASRERHPLLPGVPSLAELGYGRMDVFLWYGLVAPAATPAAIVQRLNTELATILDQPDVRQNFAAQGAAAGGGSPAAFDTFMRAEIARWGEVVKEAGLKAQ